MRTIRAAGIVACIVVYLLLVLSGCRKDQASAEIIRVEPPTAETPPAVASSPAAPEAEEMPVGESGPAEASPAIELTLHFVPEQVTTYRVVTEGFKSVEWKGDASAKPAWFTGGRAGNHLDMTFEQRVREVRAQGHALLEITIKTLKYMNETAKGVVLDFDSEAVHDSNDPMAALIGRSYGLVMSATGEVLEVTDVGRIVESVPGGSPAAAAAVSILRADEIKKRHWITPLTVLKEPQVRPGQSWSDIKTFSFGDLGRKSFERVYTLGSMESDGRVAVVEMEGIPPEAVDQAFGQRHPMMMDSDDQYEGRLELNLDTGQVGVYIERMVAEWVMADPATVRGQADLAALKMAATWLHRLERVE